MQFKYKSLALCVAVGTTGLAHAQLEEVIVTAQKREQSLQDVPISIVALDATALERASINSFLDIRALVPSLTIRPNPVSTENLAIAIRNVSPGALEQTQDLTTAVHLNGIYIARANGLNMALADLERIEVLRGPQGTLYGRNATAGAVNFITRKPEQEFGFRQQLTLGEWDQILSKTSLNVPITDQLAIRVNYLHDERDGWIDNSFPGGSPLNDREADAARIDLRWTPLEALTLDYGFDWSRSQYYSQPFQCSTIAAGTFGLLVDPAACSEDRLDKIPMRGEAAESEVWARGHTLSAAWDVAENHTLKLLAGYREFDDQYQPILFAGGARITAAGFLDTRNDFAIPAFQFEGDFDRIKGDYSSLELQWLGAWGETLSWTAGVYWFEEDGTEDFSHGSQLIVFADSSSRLFPNGFVSPAGPRDLEVNNESNAVYMQLKWTPEFTGGRLDIIPGIRWTEDDRYASLFDRRSNGVIGDPVSTNPSVVGIPAEFDDSFSETTPAFTLQYRVTEDVMVYAKYAEGYRSGGTAIRGTPTPGSLVFRKGFEPETLESYEIGVKGQFLDDRLRVNANVYLSEFTDQQISVRNTDPVVGIVQNAFDIFNAGESSYEGFEVDMSASLTQNLRLDVSYAWIDQEIDSVSDPGTGTEIKQFFHVLPPEHTAAVTLAYTQRDFCIGSLNLGTLDASVTWSYSDSFADGWVDLYSVNPATGTATLLAVTNPDAQINPSYDLWDARVALSDLALLGEDKGSFGIAVWGKNLADEEYSLRTSPVLTITTPYQRYWGEPRSFGVDLVYEF